jgi:thiol:disulfide interchange protein
MRRILLIVVAATAAACAHSAAPVVPSPAAPQPPRVPAAAEPPPATWTITARHWPVPTWTRDADAGLAEAKRLGRRVLLVFCADWAMPCLEMSQSAFVDPRVVRQLGGPVVPVAVDVTLADEDPAAAALEARYGVSGTPTLILLDAAGRELARADRWLDAAGLLALLAASDLPAR